MALYRYEVVDSAGESMYGQLEAVQEQAVIDYLRKMGYFVVDVAQIQASALGNLFNLQPKVKVGDLSMLCRQLGAMLDAGIALTRALVTLSLQVSNPVLQKALSGVARGIEGGISFSDALRAYPGVFPAFFIELIRAGEVSGSLGEVLKHLSEQLQYDKNLRDNIRSATTYPLVLTGFAILVILGMLLFVVPIFIKFFPANVAMPAPTRVMIALSGSLRYHWPLWLLAAVVLTFGVRHYFRSPAGKRAWDSLKFKLPVIGELMHKVAMARFSHTFATMLSAGIPVLQALDLAGPATGNILIEEALKGAAEQVQEGVGIATTLGASGIFPPMIVQMVAVGENTGSLPSLLMRMASFYEAEVTAMTKELTSLVEPLMTIVIGCVVGLMVISLYLPIFLAVTSVGGG